MNRSRPSVKTPSPSAAPAATARPDVVSKELGLLRDELRSLGDAVRSLEKKVIVLEFNMPSKYDVETVKAELRLIRNDIASLEKKPPIAAEAELTA